MQILFDPRFWCEMFWAFVQDLFDNDYEARA